MYIFHQKNHEYIQKTKLEIQIYIFNLFKYEILAENDNTGENEIFKTPKLYFDKAHTACKSLLIVNICNF